MKNPTCVLLLALWSMFSPPWTDAQPNRRRYWATTPDWMTSSYSTPNAQPNQRTYWTTTPDWMTSSYSTPTAQPNRRRYWATIEPPYGRRKYWRTTAQPNRRTYWTTTPDWMTSSYSTPNIPTPTVEMYQHVNNQDNIVVICQFGMKSHLSFFELFVQSNEKASLVHRLACTEEAVCMCNLTVTPQASFTCVHKMNTPQGPVRLVSNPYTYTQSAIGQQISSSSFYTGFASIIGTGLIFMVITVIVVTLRARHND